MKIPQEYFDKVKSFYHGDIVKTWGWFAEPNPCLKFYSPLDAMKNGQGEAVKKHINDAIIYKKKL